ncbi:altronate hydrolase [Actinacidiphila alni]|uniref:Altronate hydrolase n=1 Tax=Actinacidiphila alni TaxID=380248 RepID=A0A1I2HJT0_9ACTN|nr:altronate dehydratase family protein [Actinacidiphila alni]SFF30565.1 altronate hydrolase [Actinacidiphila alni]
MTTTGATNGSTSTATSTAASTTAGPRQGAPFLRLHPDDDVAVALRALAPGQDLDGLELTVRDAVPRGHKLAVRDLPAGATVRKYGQVIGVTDRPVRRGEHLHAHNLRIGTLGRDEVGDDVVARLPELPAGLRLTFDGYRRPDGGAATRNYIGVLSSVNCSATVARLVADQVTRSGVLADHPNVDGVVALTHPTGCGMTPDGDGMEMLRRTLSGYAAHPNFAAVIVVGLGCEVNTVAELTDRFARDGVGAAETLTIQAAGGTRAAVREGVERIRDLLPTVNAFRRAPLPVSELVLGLQCGGSDGFSGITANPALGVASDLLVAAGGTSVLGETPEIYGAEHLLARRAVTPEVAERLYARIRWWEQYTAANNASMDNNPSPGNKAGGLTTILEKSLGAAAKGGQAPLAGVFEYAERVGIPGFVFMDTPGYDPVSVTGMVAGGANVLCFTTGRGSVFGCKPVPCLKLSTNTDLYEQMTDDMDLDCGGIVDGSVTVEEVGRRIYDAVLDTASGRQTASELLGFGDNEFAPWQLGAVM